MLVSPGCYFSQRTEVIVIKVSKAKKFFLIQNLLWDENKNMWLVRESRIHCVWRKDKLPIKMSTFLLSWLHLVCPPSKSNTTCANHESSSWSSSALSSSALSSWWWDDDHQQLIGDVHSTHLLVVEHLFGTFQSASVRGIHLLREIPIHLVQSGFGISWKAAVQYPIRIS